MKKNIRLADIYVRIYNKRPLTLDDLVFLSKYDRECFEKTYQNVMYTLADARGQKKPAVMDEKSVKECGPDTEKAENEQRTEKSEKPDIKKLLRNIQQMQWEDFPVPLVEADNVKNLLGSLYMEKLFPHNDKYRYFQLEDGADTSTFNKQA